MNTSDANEAARRLAADWYRKLDVHAPLAEYADLLAGDDLEMRFPEGTFRGFDGFRQWYERVIRLFFDEQHTIKQVELTPSAGPDIPTKVIVRWEASVWTPPEPSSRRIKMDAYQTWALAPAPKLYGLVIKTYIVDDMKYDPDSAKL